MKHSIVAALRSRNFAAMHILLHNFNDEKLAII